MNRRDVILGSLVGAAVAAIVMKVHVEEPPCEDGERKREIVEAVAEDLVRNGILASHVRRIGWES